MRAVGRTGGDTHVEEQIGLYFLGELPVKDAIPMRIHVDGCGQCHDTQAEVLEVLAALALLTDQR